MEGCIRRLPECALYPSINEAGKDRRVHEKLAAVVARPRLGGAAELLRSAPRRSAAAAQKGLPHISGNFGGAARLASRALLEEGQKIGVDDAGVGCGHAVREAWIDLQRGVFQYFCGH
jgi:hypothetical protein